MPGPQRRFHVDEELGKKDDDHKPGTKGPLGRSWQQRRLPNGPRRSIIKRIALGLLVLIGFYYFIKNMPTDLKQPRQRPSYMPPAGPNAPGSKTVPNSYESNSRTADEETDTPVHNFNGVCIRCLFVGWETCGTRIFPPMATADFYSQPIKFYQLASTLHAVTHTRGSELINQNVVGAGNSI